MWDMNEVREVRPVRDHILHVTLDNGMAAEIDLVSYPDKGPVFAPLADVSFFQRVSIEGGTLTWPNGADISPERVFELVEKAATTVPG